MSARRPQRKRRGGFTLAELIVATTILTVVMTAVYSAFSTTIRVWRLAETHQQTYQDARIALSTMTRELNCILGGTEYLFQGKDDELEFFAVTPPMDVEKGEGARVLWIRYRYNGPADTLIREERIVEGPIPTRRRGYQADEFDMGRIKMGRKHKFDVASNVRGFDIEYRWIPPHEQKKGEPPEWLEPIVLDKNEQDWGLPQGLRITLTLDDPELDEGRQTFTTALTFRGPTTPYDEKKVGSVSEQ
ncbi:MAG: prepilin-type N-terminal cleavage/methylation domain-containing protein [Nitrospiraceae bacterium]|nr:prepilin-type N-terminal cleavage/methylation domain-containing protein [Nitrospiraceae bacterium]